MTNYDRLFDQISELVMLHSPSGVESEVDQFILQKLTALNVQCHQDQAGNIIAFIPGKNPDISIAITAHKDEIGAIVKSIHNDGIIQVRKLGGSFPWVYGEGVVDLLGDHDTISGILCFGSRHVSHESPQMALQNDMALKWENAWIETKLSLDELTLAGVRPGTRMVVGKHRKQPFRLKDYIASYTLDNKASVAILLSLAERLKNPDFNVYLIASAKEEVGAIGALFFTQTQKVNGLIALEICPLSSEYQIKEGIAPVLLAQDGYGIYDEELNQQLLKAAKIHNIPVQLGVISGFGSDASIAMKFGHVAKASCLAFPTQNTHGYEIAHLGAIANCIDILTAYCQQM
jgi:putative aminopeptidase FrvX